MNDSEQNNKKKNKKSNIKRNLSIVVGAMVVLMGVFGYQYYQTQKQFEQRRQAMQVQRQKLIEHYQEQGLSEEEIEVKLEEERAEMFDRGDFQPTTLQRIMFGFRRLTGGGPGGGQGRGMNQK